ncbi:MAG: DUF6538 domain-containing protein [Burkholderiales bacterium]
MRIPQFLYRSRHGVYYFRVLIPKPLRTARPTLPKELKTSLKCSSRVHAGPLARRLYLTWLVLRTNLDGFQIEVLPKVGKAIGGGDAQARRLLIEMRRCLGGFRHVQTDSAKLVATHMPLLEVFIGEFVLAVEQVRSGPRRLLSTARLWPKLPRWPG